MRFASFLEGAECVRAISQSGLHPANCRLLDAGEARLTMAGDGSTRAAACSASSPADHPRRRERWRGRWSSAREHGGTVARRVRRSAAARTRSARWREAFLGAPYVRDVLVAMGVLCETFETAITWERFAGFHERVLSAADAGRAAKSAPEAEGRVSCRFTHVYPDGPAPYFTVIAPARRGEEVEQWARDQARPCRRRSSPAGGTITHHHAVGRDHRPWYDRQRPQPFAEALRAAKAALDPAGIMNPGVLIDPLP